MPHSQKRQHAAHNQGAGQRARIIFSHYITPYMVCKRVRLYAALFCVIWASDICPMDRWFYASHRVIALRAVILPLAPIRALGACAQDTAAF